MSLHEAAVGMAAVREVALTTLGQECRLVAAARDALDTDTAATLAGEGVRMRGPHVAAVWLFRVGRVLVRLHVLAGECDLATLRGLPLQLAKLALQSAKASQLSACEEAVPLDTRRDNGCSLWCPLCDEEEEKERQSNSEMSRRGIMRGDIVRPLAVRPEEACDSLGHGSDRKRKEEHNQKGALPPYEEEEEEDDGYVEFKPVTAEEMASMDLGISRMALSPPMPRLRPSSSVEVSYSSRRARSSTPSPVNSPPSVRRSRSPRKSSSPATSPPSRNASPFRQRALATSPPQSWQKAHSRMQSLESACHFEHSSSPARRKSPTGAKLSLDNGKANKSSSSGGLWALPSKQKSPTTKRSPTTPLPRKASLDSLSRNSLSKKRSLDMASSGTAIPARSPSRSPKERRRVPKPSAELLAEGVCAGCGAHQSPPKQFKLCGRCHSVLYCTRECQAGHWQQHRPACSKRLREAQAPASP